MAFEGNEFGKSKGAPGLPFGNWKNSETGIMQEATTAEGGFPCFGKAGAGEADKVYLTQASAVNAAKRAFDITPTVTTAASGTVKLLLGGVEIASATTTSSSTVASLVTALVAALSDAAKALYTFTGSSTKIAVQAKANGADRNDDVFTADVGESGFTVTVGDNSTDGATAVTATYFKGIAERTTDADSFVVGQDVSVIKKGEVCVYAGADVVAGNTAYVNASNAFTSSSSSATEIGKFKTDAASGELVVVDLK